MPFNAKPEHYEPLEQVITLAEACRRWERAYSTIAYAIDAKNVAGIKYGKIRLVSVASMTAWFGDPPHKSVA